MAEFLKYELLAVINEGICLFSNGQKNGQKCLAGLKLYCQMDCTLCCYQLCCYHYTLFVN